MKVGVERDPLGSASPPRRACAAEGPGRGPQLAPDRGACVDDLGEGARSAGHHACGAARPPGRAGRRGGGLDAVAVLRPSPDHAQKKTRHASEQDRPDVLRRRQAWFEGQLDLEPERLVFIDETWASTNMARTHGRCRRGERLRVSVPHGHWKTTTFVAGLRASGMVAPFVLDGPINADAFEVYVEKILVPELRPGDIRFPVRSRTFWQV